MKFVISKTYAQIKKTCQNNPPAKKTKINDIL